MHNASAARRQREAEQQIQEKEVDSLIRRDRRQLIGLEHQTKEKSS